MSSIKSFGLFIIAILLMSYFMLFFKMPSKHNNDVTEEPTSQTKIDVKRVAIQKDDVKKPFEIKEVHYHKAIYSSLIGYYDIIFKDNEIQKNLFAVEIGNSSNEDIQVFVNISVEEISFPEQKIVTIAPHSTEVVAISPKLISSSLIELYEQKVFDMSVDVVIQDKDTMYNALKETIPLTFFPVNSMKFSMYDFIKNKHIDTRPFLSAYVDPAFFEIDEILRHISKKNGGYLTGYQELTAQTQQEIVLSQMKSIFLGLRDLQMTYVNNPVDYSGDQKIKTPSEAIKYQSANCIEGVILFASIIEALGMEPLIVLVPGHAFVGWKTWTNSNNADFLETTMIWSVNSPSFDIALNAGRKQYQSAIDEGFFKNSKALVLDIVSLRQAGILPISVSSIR